VIFQELDAIRLSLFILSFAHALMAALQQD
jgi:hypothetical protein